jgi:hypothetical protein
MMIMEKVEDNTGKSKFYGGSGSEFEFDSGMPF